jgi:type VI secretion system protein ImpH
MSDLITQLKQDPFQFGLFQAASLLERIAQGQGDTAHWGPSDHPVRFKSDITLGFPAGDIQSIRTDDSGSYQVYTSLMCLAGSRGPLPLVFTEMLLASRRNKDHAPVDFMDVFNHRLLHLLFQAKQKYHLSLGARHLADMPLLRFVDASASLGFREKRGLDQEAIWLKHAALMGAAPRSMSSLLAMLHDRLGIRFEAQQFFGEWPCWAGVQNIDLPLNWGSMPHWASGRGTKVQPYCYRPKTSHRRYIKSFCLAKAFIANSNGWSSSINLQITASVCNYT